MTTTPVRRRTRARELALQFLYACEMRGPEAMAELDDFVDHHTKTGDKAAEEAPSRDRLEIAAYSRSLVHGVVDNLDEINRWIEHIAHNWRLDRMAHLDRNILRIALYELLHQPDVPFKVVINEAIDIAKRFSTGQSGSFVNGILDRARVLIQDARTSSGLTVPTAPEGPAPLRDPVPRPRPRTDEAPTESTVAEAEDGAAMPQEGEFPTPQAPEYPVGGELADPDSLPRPRRRRTQRRRRPGGSGDSRSAHDD